MDRLLFNVSSNCVFLDCNNDELSAGDRQSGPARVDRALETYENILAASAEADSYIRLRTSVAHIVSCDMPSTLVALGCHFECLLSLLPCNFFDQATSAEIMNAVASGELASLPINASVEADVDELLSVVEKELRSKKESCKFISIVIGRTNPFKIWR